MMNVTGSGYPKQNFSFGRSGERFVEALGRTTKGMIEYKKPCERNDCQ